MTDLPNTLLALNDFAANVDVIDVTIFIGAFLAVSLAFTLFGAVMRAVRHDDTPHVSDEAKRDALRHIGPYRRINRR